MRPWRPPGAVRPLGTGRAHGHALRLAPAGRDLFQMPYGPHIRSWNPSRSWRAGPLEHRSGFARSSKMPTWDDRAQESVDSTGRRTRVVSPDPRFPTFGTTERVGHTGTA